MKPSLELQQLTDCLLSEETTWAEKRNCLEQIAYFFAKLGIYDIQYNSGSRYDNGVLLDNGYAIGSWAAAMCLMEISRTRAFVAGIIAAIRDLLANTNRRPLQILDAGCGPFALLSILPSLYFSEEEVCFTLLDILPENTAAAASLIKLLDVEQKFGKIYTEDATKFTWNKDISLDMVISETMLNALRKEPQVAITMNLAPQLNSNGIFIPEQIDVYLARTCLTTEKDNNQLLQHPQKNFEKIADLLTVTKNSFTQFSERIQLPVIQLPDQYNPEKDFLSFQTTVIVYRSMILKGNDCSLTLPFYIGAPHKNKIEKNATLSFIYTTTKQPGILYTKAQ